MTQITCAHCSKPLSSGDGGSRFSVGGDATGVTPAGHWCSMQHWLASRYGLPADAPEVQAAYRAHFLPEPRP